MLGDFITKTLVAIVGYAYPAFECYKTVEKNRVEIEELRFWCQYWIIIAALTIFEKFGDIFVSWFPMYGEMKLAFIIYLWHPKAKGASYVYEAFLRPHIANYEPDIDRKLMEFRTRAWDLVISYWQNCAKYGQSTFFQFLQYLAAQSQNASVTTTEKANVHTPSATSSIHYQSNASPPRTMTSMKFTVSQAPKIDQVQECLPCETPSRPIVSTTIEDPDNAQEEDQTSVQEPDMAETLRAARIRLRRSQPSKK